MPSRRCWLVPTVLVRARGDRRRIAIALASAVALLSDLPFSCLASLVASAAGAVVPPVPSSWPVPWPPPVPRTPMVSCSSRQPATGSRRGPAGDRRADDDAGQVEEQAPICGHRRESSRIRLAASLANHRIPLRPAADRLIRRLPDRPRSIVLLGARARDLPPRLAWLAPVVLVGAVVIAAAPPVLSTAETVEGFVSPDTRDLARTWMLEHVPAGTAIAREAYTPQFSQDEYRLRGSYFLPQRTIDDYRRAGVRYLISSDRTVERYLTSSGGPASTGYSQIYRLPEVFRADPSATRRGPTIRIFELDP